MRTMTLNLSEAEMLVVEQLAEAKGLSKTGVLRQALRLYQTVDRKLAGGHRMIFAGEAGPIGLDIIC